MLTAIALATPAAAQESTPSSQSDESTPVRGRALDMSGWIGAGYDVRYTGMRDLSSKVDPSLEADGEHGQAGLALSFVRLGPRASFNTSVQSGIRADATTERLWAGDYQASFGMGLQLTRRLQVETRHFAKYAAVNPLAIIRGGFAEAGGDVPQLGDALTQPGSDRPFAVRQALTSVSDTAVTYDVSRRTSLVLTHSYGYIARGLAEVPLHTQASGGRIERKLTPYLTGRLGYRLAETTFDKVTGSMLKMHDLDTGFVYQRPLPFSRRSLISFDTGSSIVQDRTRRVFRFTGGTALTYPLGRYWLARVALSRPVQMMEGMAAPIIATSASAVVSGSIGRRHSLIASADRFAGTMSLDYTNAERSDGYSTSIRWRTALTRRFALNVEAFQGRVRFGSDASLLSGLAPDSSRLGARVFVSFWRPLFRD